jgi:hypothetical protein
VNDPTAAPQHTEREHCSNRSLSNCNNSDMPVQYLIDKQHRLVITSAWGLVTFAEYKLHQDQLIADPEFSPTFNHLVDSTRVNAIDLSTNEIRTITGRSVFSPASKRAVIAPNPAYFGLARMAEAYHSMADTPSEIRVFSDLSSALKWLGLSESDIQLPGVSSPRG